MSLHPKQHIPDLAYICFEKGVSKIVISPGSRNAPLIQAFHNLFGERCISIPDERSAAYVALGLAQYNNSPVVLICTSGTAVLNYAPAIAEAYYQQIPLIAITADRPNEWIDQNNNQTINQNNVYTNFIKKSHELPKLISSKDDLWYCQRIINESINYCLDAPKGPIHINIPLCEPLYEKLPDFSKNISIINTAKAYINISLTEELENIWNNANRILIIHGCHPKNTSLSHALNHLSNDGRVTILAENVSNVKIKIAISQIELVFTDDSATAIPDPDLVIYSGGQVVSKKLKEYFRCRKIKNFWRVGMEKNIIDTYQNTSITISSPPEHVYDALCKIKSQSKIHVNSYQHILSKKQKTINDRLQSKINNLPFCDIKAMKIVLDNLEGSWNIHLANSTPIRYSQLFTSNQNFEYFGNRGVSGIDGSLSSAVGSAMASRKNTLIFIGDISFVYDTNALWHNVLPPNLKIVLFNNKGGNIFHLIEGPSKLNCFNSFFEAHHHVSINYLSKAYGVAYFSTHNDEGLNAELMNFLTHKNTAAVLEINTVAEVNKNAYKESINLV